MNIGIIGGGIVGLTAAYYLSKTHQVTLYDDGKNQATRASAGIICPWLSQRRNKDWYRLTANGAAFYQTLCHDLQQDNIPTTFYRQNGALFFKKTPELLHKLYQLAQQRKEIDSFIGDISLLSSEIIKQQFPELQTTRDGIFISGGACIDGRDYLKAVKKGALQNGCLFKNERVSITQIAQHHDKIIICAGAFSKELLESIGYTVDITAQKGQLFTVDLSHQHTENYPVIIPQSEFDLLPYDNGHWVIGATHEKNKGFDTTVDYDLLNAMKEQAALWLSELHHVNIKDTRVGTRAFTSDYLPCFGKVPYTQQLYIASGLGSSGLTNGPYIAYLLSLMLTNKTLPLDISAFDPRKYITLTSTI